MDAICDVDDRLVHVITRDPFAYSEYFLPPCTTVTYSNCSSEAISAASACHVPADAMCMWPILRGLTDSCGDEGQSPYPTEGMLSNP